MSLLGGIGIDSAMKFATGLLDRVWPKSATMEEKMQAVSQIAPLIEDRDDVIVGHQKDIIVSEMNQGDNYTKRARPTVVYAGLAFIAIVNVIIPSAIKIILILNITSSDPGQLATTKAVVAELTGLTSLQLPSQFWWAWSSVVGIWAIGRTAEKRGVANKLVEMITGAKK